MKARMYKRKVSYIISASLGKGCYRHIRVSGRDTLDDLAGYILDAFDFDFDHLYSFFMDNKWWSEEGEYGSPYGDNPPYADEIRLEQLGLEKGRQFKFLFDYGDEWRFQCKVLEALDEETTESAVVYRKGEAPEQYPDYSGEYDEDDPDFERSAELPYDFQIPEQEVPDALLEASFRFSGDKLWKKIRESENFAVKLSNGEIGYCCVMGSSGECIALTLYIGDEGLRSLDAVMRCNDADNPFVMLIEQNCLQAGLDNKSDLPEEVALPVRKYAKEHGINLRGRKTYPNFLKFQSYYTPNFITDEGDFLYLLEALNAAHAVSEALKNGNKLPSSADEAVPTIPLLTPDNGGYKWSLMKLPEIKPAVFPTPALKNDSLFNQIKKLKKCGTWECRHYIINQPDMDPEKGKPVFPSLIVCADLEADQVRHIKQNSYYPDSAEELLAEFAEMLLDYGSVPKKILTSGERSAAFFGNFCDKLGIRLEETDHFTVLDEILDEVIADSFDSPDEMRMDNILEMLGSLSEEDLDGMPPMLLNILREMIGEGILPAPIEKKLKK